MTLPSQTLPDYLLRWPRLESLCQQVKKLLQAFFIINGLPQPVNGNRPTAARPPIRSPSPVRDWRRGLEDCFPRPPVAHR